MNFTLIVCTFQRPGPIVSLLDSIALQTVYPDEIIIVDASRDDATKLALESKNYPNLSYFLVGDSDRGLTKQRNFGISKTSDSTEIICFLDDDIIAEPDYFEKLIGTFTDYPNAIGVGGYITNEMNWTYVGRDTNDADKFSFEGWQREEPARFRIRKKFGLDSNVPPGFSPLFSHGRSIGFLPPSGKVYPAEQLMGGVSSFRKSVFEQFQFSEYFEGYGLYEDADFCLRVAKFGNLYVNTAANVAHYHAASGRPNQFQYGKMVVRNGWFVWRSKIEKPVFNDKIKWYAITFLLTAIRFSNIFTTSERKKSLTEVAGRLAGLFSVIINPPKNTNPN